MKKWDECLFLDKEDDILEYFSKKDNILMLLGLGFDPRTCFALKKLIDQNINMDVWLLKYDEKSTNVNDVDNISRSKRNENDFNIICKDIENKVINIPMYKYDMSKRTIIISESVRSSILAKDIEKYNEILIDISAMSHAVAFSVIKRILDIKTEKQKLYVVVCENSECDDKIKPIIVEGSAEYLQGFNTFSMLASSEGDETIWFPIIGMNEKNAFNIIDNYLKAIEICPIVPFPSIDIRRSENILRNYGETLFREKNIEKRNIIYIPENQPVIIYKKLYNTVKYYEKALNCNSTKTIKYAFSSQSSKLIDMGVFLAIVSLASEGIKTGFVIVENQGYTLDEEYNVSNDKLYCVCLNNDEFDWE